MRRLINVKVPIKYEKEIAQVGKEVCLHICAYCLSFNQGHRSGSCLISHGVWIYDVLKFTRKKEGYDQDKAKQDRAHKKTRREGGNSIQE